MGRHDRQPEYRDREHRAGSGRNNRTEQTETPEENTEQPAEDTPTQSEPDTVYAVDTVNVRAAADTESDKIGTLEKGTALTRTGTDGEWSVVNYNGQTGYIKTEYLTTKNSDSDSDNGGNEEQTTTSNFIAEGTVITLSDSINIRSGMSENDSKIGTAFSGEKDHGSYELCRGMDKGNLEWTDRLY